LFAKAARAIVPAPGTKGGGGGGTVPHDRRRRVPTRRPRDWPRTSSCEPVSARSRGPGTAGRPLCGARRTGCSMRESSAIRRGIGRQDRLRRHAV
jgi:hypothetical protein